MDYKLYNDILDPKEESLGYKKVYLVNPRGSFHANPSIVPAVIYWLGQGDVIIKLNNPMTRKPEYSHQKYGHYDGTTLGRPDWKALLVAVETADGAIRMIDKDLEQKVGGAAKINLVKPEMILRCPKCNKEFTKAIDHLPFDGQTICPECEHTAPTGEFNAYNV